MKIIQNQTFDSERALYNIKDTMVEWLFKSMLGIKIKAPNTFEISPVIGEGVDHASGSYNSLYGEIKVNWKKLNNKVNFEVEVPVNSKAMFIYGDVRKELEPGKYQFSI